ncbi:MAG: tRNA (N(6)-L-threonylcarbamoyladenosine(37)-C(2))-methylthiotransferase MtaB [Candidatus Omnitrophica bacterium]|nr:tRNA (N(6)-L-threonylcarbamoyladenosine(37)-C(2))-methylthiotransferase MtaB [Candidatus Omnitrophota bacterium]
MAPVLENEVGATHRPAESFIALPGREVRKSLRVRFVTLGCKVNQYETQGMREALAGAGIEESSDLGKPCDFVVINTCTVTDKADKENHYWIRRARREHPFAKLIVTGCYVERDHLRLAEDSGVDLIIPNSKKSVIADYLTPARIDSLSQVNAGNLKIRALLQSGNPRHTYCSLPVSRSDGRTRGYIKVQDGCNHACSFCKVVLVRGRSRSRPIADIVDEAKRLRDAGYREVVFTGIQLGAYGMDFDKKQSLVDILESCAAIEGLDRLRISSMEPMDVQEQLIAALRDIPKCCHHLHIPLQSGDNEILKRMNRRYDRSFYMDLVTRLKSMMPDFSLTLDVMAGFPGEEEPHFQNTVQLLHKVRPLKCHVFPYSRREGTRAARWQECPRAEMLRRVRRLLEIGHRLGAQERQSYVGRTLPVLVETKIVGRGVVQGLTANYLKVRFQGGPDLMGQIVPVRLTSLNGDTLSGTLD